VSLVCMTLPLLGAGRIARTTGWQDTCHPDY